MSAIELVENQQHQSPFDAIRGYRADGSEYWTGRELMRWLGYSKWQNAEKAIKRAILSLQNQGQDPRLHLTEVSKINKRGKGADFDVKDFELSRLGCYTIAMNADPEKEMVSLAQAYFFKKTREAEVVIPAQTERLRELELELQLIRAKTDCHLSEQKLIDTRHIIVTTCPEPVQQKILGYQVVEKIEYRDRIIHDDDIIRDGTTINKTALCNRYGLLSKSGNPNYKQLNQLLDKLPSQAFRLTAVIQENRELDLAFLAQLDRVFQSECRQLNLGEV